MAENRAECLDCISRFLSKLKEEISLEGTYLFGSHLRGGADRDSDIDLAVISKNFESMNPLDRLVFLGKIAWRAGTPEIEAIGYTPDEFYRGAPWDFSSEVLRTGQQIF